MREWFAPVFASPLFGIALSIFAYWLGVQINQKTRSPLCNPLLLAIGFIIAFLLLLGIPLSDFQKGGSMISALLAPATAALAISIYRQRAVLKARFLPVVLGCLVGSVTSMASAYGLCRLFGLDSALTASLLPKSVTTAIAIEISQQAGGIGAVTVVVVVATGILGAVLAPVLIKVFGVKDKVAAGVAIGTCSHAIGTSKALELGEVEGAMSGIAIGIAGILTVILSLLI